MQAHVKYRTSHTNGHALDELLEHKRSRIKWTEKEERAIAEKLATQIIRKPYTRNFKKAINVAQEELTKEGKLDANRHREIQSVANIPGIMSITREILRRYYENSKQVDKAHEILKTQHQKHLTREQVLDSLTSEEIEVYFQDTVMELTSPAELLKWFSPQDLLANLPTAAILSAATYRMAEQMEQQTQAMAAVATLVGKLVPSEAKPKTTKPLIQIAGIHLKRVEEVTEGLADVCHVQRIDPVHLSPQTILENAKWVVLWSNQLTIPQRDNIKKFALRKNLAIHQVVEASGSLDDIIRTGLLAACPGRASCP